MMMSGQRKGKKGDKGSAEADPGNGMEASMATAFRVATFNLENLDDKPDQQPSLDERIAVMRPQLIRLKADIL